MINQFTTHVNRKGKNMISTDREKAFDKKKILNNSEGICLILQKDVQLTRTESFFLEDQERDKDLSPLLVHITLEVFATAIRQEKKASQLEEEAKLSVYR